MTTETDHPINIEQATGRACAAAGRYSMSKRLADLRARNKAGRHVSLNEAEELLHEITRLRLLEADLTAAQAVIDSYGLTTADGVVVKCTDAIFGPSAIEGDDTICEIYVGGPHLFIMDEEGEDTGKEWDLVANSYSTKAAAEAAKEADHAG